MNIVRTVHMSVAASTAGWIRFACGRRGMFNGRMLFTRIAAEVTCTVCRSEVQRRGLI